MGDWLRAFRVHQWLKNTLILLPVASSHTAPTLPALILALQIFLALSFTASGLYLVNDVLDREHDRQHPRKQSRPIASGAISATSAWVIAGLLLLSGTLIGFAVTPRLGWLVLAYATLSALYSFRLKRVIALDIVVLASLYTTRVIAGGIGFDIELTGWFLAFSIFLFSSLALLKRVVELNATLSEEAGQPAKRVMPGRGYQLDDMRVLTMFGIASAMSAGVIYCLYITSPEILRLYMEPEFLWLGLPMILYWVTRIWILALRGEVHDDPVVFTLKDSASYVTAAAFFVAIWLAT